MPRAKDSFKASVSEATSADVRTITVTINMPAKDFSFADSLRERGVVGGVEALLKQASKDAVQKYLDGVEDLIAGLKKAGAGNKTKPMTATVEANSQAESSTAPESGEMAQAAAG